MVVVIAALALLPGADPVDREELRKLVELPRITLTCGVSMSVNSRGEIHVPDWTSALPGEIAAAEKSLLGDAEDAGRYRALADLYYRANDPDRGRATLAKARDLYRAQLAVRPGDGLLLARFADCLEVRHRRQRDEAERLLRQAVRLAPAEWECWVLLGSVLEQKANDVLAADESVRVQFLPTLLERRAFEGKITAEDARRAQDHFAEALGCFDRGVASAPREPTVHLARAGFRNNRVLGGMIGKFVCGGTLDTYPGAAMADNCADLERAAALKPDDHTTVLVAAVFESIRVMLVTKEKGLDEAASLAAMRAMARGLIARLEKLPADAEPRAAGRTAAMVALLHVYEGDPGKALASLSRSVRLNPDFDPAWDMRIGLLGQQKKGDELLAASRERVEHKDSPRNRFFLARACEKAEQPAEAVRVLEAALSREPDDLLCNLSLAALLMRQGDGELKRAGQLLDRAEQTWRKDPRQEGGKDYLLLRITLLALEGQADLARELLRQLGPHAQADSRVQELSKLLEPSAVLSPTPLPPWAGPGFGTAGGMVLPPAPALGSPPAPTPQGSLLPVRRPVREPGRF